MRPIALLAALALTACAPQAPTQEEAKSEAPAAPATIAAPAGEYKLDPNHSSLIFSVKHLGLSDYRMRFTGLDASVTLNPTDVSASSLVATIDAASVRGDYPGDYRATHGPRGRPYESWSQDLATAPEFLNAGRFPQITFRSTRIEPTGENTARITGDLSMLGRTQPVTLEATLVNAMAAHPFNGRGVFGVSARGTLNRSDFGMTHLIEPGIAGDAVTVEFNGEFQQVAPEAPAN